MTYGRFTLEEWEQRAGNPYLLENGRWYRITDHHVVVGLKQVNYQAEECDPREVERWMAEHSKPDSRDNLLITEGGSVLMVEQIRRTGADTGYFTEGIPDSVLNTDSLPGQEATPRVDANPEQHWSSEVFHNQELPETERAQQRMTLSQYARLCGWQRGRISNAIRESYQRKYGEEDA